MVEIAVDRLQPLGQEALPCLGTGDIQPPAAVLAPDDIAQAVAVVEESGLEDLLMQACAVEAAGKGTLDIGDQFALVTGGVDAVGVESLVQYQSLEDFFAVEQHHPVLAGDGTHTKVAGYAVTFIAEGEAEIIKPSCTDFPQMELVQLHLNTAGLALDDGGGGTDCAILVEGFSTGNQAVGIRGAQLDGEFAFADRGIVFRPNQVGIGGVLQPNSLPDAGGAGIGAATGVVVSALLAPGLIIGP